LLKIKPVKEWRSIYFIWFMFIWVWHIIVIGWVGLAIGWIPAVPMAFMLSTENRFVFAILSFFDWIYVPAIFVLPFILEYWLVEKFL
jgi:hypothetical protein